jgi:putative iron-regulated protein
MRLQLKLWSGAGAVALIGIAPFSAGADIPLGPHASAPESATASAGGEGGEGGGEAGGAVPSQYRLMLNAETDPIYDGASIASAHVDDVALAYQQAARAARILRQAIGSLLESPTEARLAAARRAWLEARRPYLATEALRFYDGPIDGPGGAQRPAGPESRLNAWPLNEAVIDYVEGEPRAGLVQDTRVALDAATILARDQVSDEADVTTGWHAVEFLLWGQDRDSDGPGARPASDYVAGEQVRDRRRTYLALLAEQLVIDIEWLATQWQRDREHSYAREFLALEPHEAIGRMLTGAALLAGHELASERLAVALDSGSQEDEQSCFSDSTWQDFVWGLAGIKRVYYGRDAKASLASTLHALDPRLARDIDLRFAEAERRVAALHDPFDQILRSDAASRERAAAEAAVTALQRLAAGLRDGGRALGVLVIVPGV